MTREKRKKMKTTVIYQTSPSTHKIVLEMDAYGVVSILREIEEKLLKGVAEEISDNWTQITITIVR